MNYIPLNIKTHYELLSSIIKIEDLIIFAKKYSIESLGITDSNMFGCIEFYNACKRNNIKPIIGLEIKVEDLNMILYAKNYNGYVKLLNITSIKNIGEITKENLRFYKDDLICVTKDYNSYLSYKEIYENVYLSYNTEEEKKSALIITDKIVYMKESLYFEIIDKEYLIYLNMIKDGKTIDDIGNYIYDNHLNYDIESIDANTTKSFIENINIELPEFKFELPEYSSDKEELIRNLANKGLNKRLNNNVSDEYLKRLNSELEIISSMGFTDYFLIVYDFILYAKKNGIVVGPGRGSAAGSLVCYSLGITEIDPLKYNLIFERFLNPERITMPDIDVDIDYLKRDEIVEYVRNKYGKDKVANIITFGTLLTKQVIRDIGRILKIPTQKIDLIVKTIKDKETFEDLKNNDYFKTVYKKDDEYEKLIRISSHLEGLKRHTSVHAAGVVISKYPLMNRIPLYKSGETLLTGYTMEYLEDLGLLKIDFLALRNISTIDQIIKKIKEDKGIYINVNKIPLDDKKTIEVFNKVHTIGIFQFESEGMMSFLKSLKVSSFDDLVSAIALYRPGPREHIPEFIKVREGRKKPHYIVKELEGIIKSTNGIIVYQEQILEILKKIGGFSYSKADIIRRAMSKKKENVILEYRKEFVNGAIKNGFKDSDANEIYDLVLSFANYGFNKSHSVAYSIVAFQMAFLKAHFTEYFMITLLNMVIGNEVKTKEYIDEARVYNLTIDGVDINKSESTYEVLNNKIIIPLTIIKNLGDTSVNHILEERKKSSFKDIYDFFKRVYDSKANTKVIESLILSGSLDDFEYNRRTLIENMKVLIEYSTLCKEIDETLVLKPEIIIYEEYENNELLEKEYQIFGFYLKNHPVTKYRRDNMCQLKDIEKYFDKIINTIGLIDVLKETQTKNKDKMAFLTISDELAKVSVVIFPKIYKNSFGIKKGDIVKVTGRVERRMSDYQIVANKIEKI